MQHFKKVINENKYALTNASLLHRMLTTNIQRKIFGNLTNLKI